MKYIKKLKPSLFLTTYILLLSLKKTALNCVITKKEQTNSEISLIGIKIFVIIYNIKKGKKTEKKAYKTGLKNGLIFTLTLIFLSIITNSFSFTLRKTLYFMIIISISIMGSIIGINKKV